VPNLNRADLSNASLNRANFNCADLSSPNLSNADLSNAHLSSADLHHANLKCTILSDADLSGANLNTTNLRFASLNGANFTDVNLSHSIVTGADFTATTMGLTILASIDLSEANGLETVRHYSPSSIDLDTLYKSAGKIPETFLRGCGVPDGFLTFIPSHFGIQPAIQFYSCFISYSHKDEDFAKHLHSRMRAANLPFLTGKTMMLLKKHLIDCFVI
jgi:uncharacterized protein YjbI with pentapeptide repeats